MISWKRRPAWILFLAAGLSLPCVLVARVGSGGARIGESAARPAPLAHPERTVEAPVPPLPGGDEERLPLVLDLGPASSEGTEDEAAPELAPGPPLDRERLLRDLDQESLLARAAAPDERLLRAFRVDALAIAALLGESGREPLASGTRSAVFRYRGTSLHVPLDDYPEYDRLRSRLLADAERGAGRSTLPADLAADVERRADQAAARLAAIPARAEE